MKIGEKAEFCKTISESDIYLYAGITGDCNSLHTNKVAAEQGEFHGRVAHGMLVAGLVSTVIGTKLPGDGAVYLSQSLDFKYPVRIGDTVTAICEVVNVLNPEKGIFRLLTKCVNQYGTEVLDGEAVIKYNPETNCDTLEQYKTSNTFYSEQELSAIGLKKYGSNVLISRNALLYNPDKLEIGNNVRIDDFVTISGVVKLGDYIHIAQFCGLYGGDAGIYFEDFAGLSSKCTVYATSNDYSGESLTNPTVPMKYKGNDKNEAVYLRKHVIVGAASVILPGVDIGEGSSVGTMTLCNKSLDPWGIYVGTPARKIGNRNKKLLELEKQLKKENQENI